MTRHRSYSIQELEDAVSDSKSWSNVIRLLNLKVGGGTYSSLKKLCQDNDIDVSHFTGQAWNSGQSFKNPGKVIPIEENFRGHPISSNSLKHKLWKAGLKKRECEECHITEWQGKPAPLELDHVDGVSTNNEFSNLRILCANCHALTDTYCGKNINRSKE